MFIIKKKNRTGKYMELIINKNFEELWDIDEHKLLSLTKNIIKKSSDLNLRLVNADLNDKTIYSVFLSQIADDITEISVFHSMVSFLQFVGKTQMIRKIGYQLDVLLTDYQNKLNLNDGIYRKIVEFYKKAKDSRLDEVDKRFLKKMVRTYRKNGIDLHPDDRSMLFRVNHEISKIEMYLYRNFNKRKQDVIAFSENELSGMPKPILNKMKPNNGTNNMYNMTMNNNMLLQSLRYINNSKIRRNIEFYRDNQFDGDMENISRLIVLRNKKAKLLGYNNYSDLKSKYHMAQNSENIKNFLNSLIGKLDYRYTKEINTIKKIKTKNNNKKKLNPSDPSDHAKINSWDVDYFIVKWRKKYGLNEQMIKKYFPIDHVIRSIFDIYEELFTVKFKRSTIFKTWNDNVVQYQVRDENNSNLGQLYLDLFERPGKINTTRCFNLRPSCMYPLNSGEYQKPVVALVSFISFNGNPKDTLLTHSEVISLFHELGHVMHQMINKSKYLVLGTSDLEIDFIQIPSLVLDNLCWEKSILQRLSSHHINGTHLPDDIIDKMIKVRNLNVGIHYKKTILSSIYDQFIHSSDGFIVMCENFLKLNNNVRADTIKENFSNLYKQLHLKIMKSSSENNSVSFNNGTVFPFNFDCILLDKHALFYCLIWAKIFAFDIYNQKFKDIRNLEKIGTEFKNKIYKANGKIDGMQILKKYLGREPTVNGFFQLFGLESDANYSFYQTDKLITNTNNTSSPTSTEIILSEAKYNDHASPYLADSNESECETNRFSEIEDDEQRFTENSVVDKINYIKNRIMLDEGNYASETTETLKKYNSIFIKN
jgi:metallopeptidase MepB